MLVKAGQRGKPSWFGSPVRAKDTSAPAHLPREQVRILRPARRLRRKIDVVEPEREILAVIGHMNSPPECFSVYNEERLAHFTPYC